MNPEIFKAYDIRGIFDQDFNLSFPYKLGQAFVALRKKDGDCKSQDPLKIVVAQDMRLSSDKISKELIRGLQDAGAQVLDANLLSTPAFYFAVSNQKADGGIIVSASHNPKEWNGFKLVRKQAQAISGETGINWLKENIDKKFEKTTNPLKVENITGMAEKQLEHDLSYINKDKIKQFKIVADAANSMGAQYLELIENSLPGSWHKLNFKLDGNFPAHEADPLKKENLKMLSEEIIKNKADLGIATDGDGDRVFFLNELGQVIDPAIIRGLLAQIFLKDKPGSKICYDVRPGKITEDLILEANGKPVITRVGHSLIKSKMLEENAYFAGESSGHFFLNLEVGCFEMPIIMIGRMLELFSSQNTPISKFIEQYNRYHHSGEINRSVNNKNKVIELIAEKYQDGKISLLDGISVEYNDFWFNVRGSNTENKVRLNLESREKDLMIKKRDELLELIESC